MRFLRPYLLDICHTAPGHHGLRPAAPDSTRGYNAAPLRGEKTPGRNGHGPYSDSLASDRSTPGEQPRACQAFGMLCGEYSDSLLRLGLGLWRDV